MTGPIKFSLAMTLAVFAIRCSAQEAAKADIFPSRQIEGDFQQAMRQAKATGSGGAMLGDYGTHSILLSERTASGGAEIHAHFDDVMVVLNGKATLITGGALIDSRAKSQGEEIGSGIRGGTAKTIEAGDVIHVPAGTPHQLIVAPGSTYKALVIKIKE
jgi:mannose-6-phosphate isomerase-like protein (cupin superfamily)